MDFKSKQTLFLDKPWYENINNSYAQAKNYA